MKSRVRVAVNGYGATGKRVADAVREQDDMELVGVADVATDFRIRMASNLGIDMYATVPGEANAMREAGILLAGMLEDLIGKTDVVVDATPKGVGARNWPLYQRMGVKAIFQGGEKHELTGHSFVAEANYTSALGRETTRIVSPDTAAIVRTLGGLRKAGLLKRASGVLIRRVADPWNSDQEGIVNTLVPEPDIPSPEAPEAKSVLPDLEVVTMAAQAPINLSDCHFWTVQLTPGTTRDQVIAAFRGERRILFIQARDGVAALNSTVTMMRDLGRPRGDMWEVGLWEDILRVRGDELYYTYQVDSKATIVPENIDAIRALTGIERNAERSMTKTDEALGMLGPYLPFFEQVRAYENTAGAMGG